MKRFFFVVAFFCVCFAFSQTCGSYGHNTTHDNNTTSPDDDLVHDFDYCFDYDLTNSEITSNNFLPVTGYEDKFYALNRLVIEFNDEVKNKISQNYLFIGKFGVNEIDNISKLAGVLRVELGDEIQKEFILVFAHEVDLQRIINDYRSITIKNNSGNQVLLLKSAIPDLFIPDDTIDEPNENKNVFIEDENIKNSVKSNAVSTGFFSEINDPEFENQSNLKNTVYPYDNSIDFERAYSILGTTSNIFELKIGVLDNFFDTEHPDLVGKVNRLFPDKNYTTNQKNYLKTNYMHGSLMSGISSANTNNSVGLAGINKNLPLNLFGCGSFEEFTIRSIMGKIIPERQKGCLYSKVKRSVEKMNKYLKNEDNKKTKVINISYVFPESDQLKTLINNNNVLFTISSGNEKTYLDYNYTDTNFFYNQSKEKPHIMIVGGVDHNRKYSGFENYGSYVSVVAQDKKVLGIAGYDNTTNSYVYKQKAGTSVSAPQVAGIAGTIFSLLFENNISVSPYQVRQIIETTAEKNNFDNNLKTKVLGTNITYYDDNKDIYLARGFVNAHQSILLAKAQYLNQNIYTPIKFNTDKKEMSYDKVLFSENKRYALSLNRHRMTGYRIVSSNVSTFNDANHGVIWDSPTISEQNAGANNTNDANNLYSKSLVLDGDKFYIENQSGGENWSSTISFSDVGSRRLTNNQSDCSGKNTCGYSDGDLLLHASLKTMNEHNELLGTGQLDARAQWFEMTESDDLEGKYFEGDLIVLRKYTNRAGNEKNIVVWSSSNGLINIEDKLTRHLLQDFIYEKEDEINDNDALTDSESFQSPNSSRELVHHNGRLSILSLKDNSNGIWEEKSVLFENEGTEYPSYRLQITNGNLEFVGGTEDENGENFQQQAVLKSFNRCINLGYSGKHQVFLSDDSNQNDGVEDGGISFYADGNELYKIETISPTSHKIMCKAPTYGNSILTTTHRLVDYNQLPIEGEINYLISHDKSKITIKDQGVIKVIPVINGYYTLDDSHVQLYNLK